MATLDTDTLEALRRYADGTDADLDLSSMRVHTGKHANGKLGANWLRVPDFDAFEVRALCLLGKHTRKTLLGFLGCSPVTYKKGMNNSAVHFGWLAKFVWHYSINPRYLVYGSEHKKYLCENDIPGINNA